MKKLFAIATVVTFCFLTNILPPELSRAATPTQVPQAKLRRSARPIRGSYIVVLDESVIGARGAQSQAPAVAGELAAAYGGQVDAVFQYALQGFSVRMSEAAAVALSKDQRVAYVEEDGETHATSVQSNAPWGLDRIDQRSLPLDTYYSIPNSGSGNPAAVNVYVLDTGIRISHSEFGGRAFVAHDTVDDDNVAGNNNIDDGGLDSLDCNGHGTHVAGIIGSNTYGVAKNVNLYSVRVLRCDESGTVSAAVNGVDWVTSNRVKPAVANMSLSVNGISSTLDTAVQNSISAGVTYTLSAGNGTNNDGIAVDACNLSPGHVGGAITVGATTSTDARASFSNFGSCVDIFAPGVNITSASYESNTATAVLSGTSQAAPHVAGAAALYLQKVPAATPATVRNALINKATLNILTSIGTGSPNRLLYSIVTPNDTDPGGTLSGGTGTLSGTGDVDYWPATSPSGGGILQAVMRGPATADFDLFLQQWNGTQWVTLAASTGTNSYEETFAGSVSGTGTFRWAVYSYSGNGSYTIVISN
jgi:subtilisin family serine protease